MASSLSFRNARHLRTKNGQTKAGCAPKDTPCQFIYILQCALRPAQSALRALKRLGEGFLLLEGQNALAVGRIAAVHEVEGLLRLGEGEGVADAAPQIDLAGVDEVDDVLELAVLQTAAAHIQLLAGDDELVDLIGGDAEAHGDDAACVASGLAGGQETAMEAGAVDDDRRAVAIGQLLSAGDDILGLGVDDVGSAVLQLCSIC